MERPSRDRFFAYAMISILVGSLLSVVLPSYASHENVTVNVSVDPVTETYNPEHSVTIVGSIDNVEEGEDVTIKFRDPSGSLEKTQNVTPDEDDGYFEYVYDIPGNADEGVWEVEAEYSSDKMYTYFIVDDDSDTITVVLDNDDGIYEAGSEVTISGQVDNQDDSEPNVEITVYDPLDPSEPIVNQEESELGDGTLSGDEFEFSFNLDDEASHGRYAVVVTYNFDDQEGSILFEIEDEDLGSSDDTCSGGNDDTDGDLSAELGVDDTFAPGDTVCLSGSINSYDSGDNEELAIVIEDPDGEEVDDYGDDDASVGSNGDFEYDFDLNDDALEGTYSITISYIDDEVVLTFDVEEAGGGGGTTEDLTVKLNKASYLAGETMTVSGTVADVADPDDEEVVSILLYTPDGQVILQASKYVTPPSSGAFSTMIVLDSDLEVDEGYEIVVSYLDDQVTKTFDITGVSSTPSDEIIVETDKEEYSIGSTVKISGQVPELLLVEDEQLLIRVNTPDGNPCRFDPIDIPSSGEYSYSLVLGGKCGVAGDYKVEVSYNGGKSSTTFQLIGASGSSYNLSVGANSYPIEYELTTGTLDRISVPKVNDEFIPKLVVLLNAEDDGTLTLVLPRDVIDARGEGEDIDYVVSIEDELGNIITVDVEEDNSSDEARTLVIDFPAGTERIEISGTQIVPEFGSIAVIALAIAIFGMIVAAGHSRFRIFRQ